MNIQKTTRLRKNDVWTRDLEVVVDLYQILCGNPGRESDFRSFTSRVPEQMRQEIIQSPHRIEYGLGSRWTPESKLFFGADREGYLQVWCETNICQNNTVLSHAESLGQTFNTLAKQYFDGVAESLYTKYD